MSEPITLYCIEDFPYGGRTFLPGDVVSLAAPSTVREFLNSGHWSPTPPDDPQTAPPDDAQTTPPAVKRGGRRKHA